MNAFSLFGTGELSSWRCVEVSTSSEGTYIGLSKSTLEKLRVTGGGPEYAALGRVVVYRVEDLDTWVSIMVSGLR